MTWPIALAIVGIALFLAAIWAVWKNWDKISGWMGDAASWMGDAFTSAFDGIVDGIMWVWGWIKKLVGWYFDMWKSIGSGIVALAGGAVNLITGDAGSTPQAARDTVDINFSGELPSGVSMEAKSSRKGLPSGSQLQGEL
jgi:hypothetical protein